MGPWPQLFHRSVSDVCSSLVTLFELYIVKYVLQTKQSVEAVNPLARLLKVEERKSKDMGDHVLSVQPERYDDLRLREHEFLIVIQCQYAPFKVSSLSLSFPLLFLHHVNRYFGDRGRSSHIT